MVITARTTTMMTKSGGRGGTLNIKPKLLSVKYNVTRKNSQIMKYDIIFRFYPEHNRMIIFHVKLSSIRAILHI